MNQADGRTTSIRATFHNILKNSATYSLSIILSKTASVVLLPVYTRYLSPADYGVMELLDLTFFVAATLLGLRLSSALFYYYSQTEAAEERRRVVSTAIIGAFLVGIFGGLLGILSAGALSRLIFGTDLYRPCFQIVFGSFAGGLIEEVGLAYIRVLDKPGTYVLIRLARLVTTITSNVILLAIFGFGIYGPLVSTFIGATSVAAFVAWYGLSRVGFSFRLEMFWRQARYSWPLAISELSVLFIHFGDRYFLQRAVSLSDIGLYSLAYRIGMLVSYVQLPFNMYWSSQMFALTKGKEGERVYIRLFTYFTLVLTVAALGLSLFSTPLLHILSTPAFENAAILVPAIAAAYLIRGMGDYLRSVFLIHKKTSIDAKVNAYGAGVRLLACAVLIPPFGAWGAAGASFLTFVVLALWTLHEAQKVRSYDFEWRRLAKVGLSAVAAFVPALLIRPEQFWLQLAVGVACLVLFVAALLGSRFFDDGEWDAISESAHSARRRLGFAAAAGSSG